MEKCEFLWNKKSLKSVLVRLFFIRLTYYLFVFVIFFLLSVLCHDPNMIVGVLLALPVYVILLFMSIMRYVFSFNGVQLYDNYIEFKTISSMKLNKKIKIHYNNIITIEKVSNEVVREYALNRYGKKKKVIVCGEEGHYVRITTRYDNEYYLPINDTDTFINDLSTRSNVNNTNL